jgi:hypothetical protein
MNAPSAKQLGDDLFDAYNIYDGEGFRNHNLRLAAFASALLEIRGLPFDEERTHLLAMVHDLGLISPVDRGADYLDRGWRLLQRESAERGCPQFADELSYECLRFNHRLRPVTGLDPRAEAFRAAVWVEHSFGRRRHGLSQELVREVFRKHPRDNFSYVMADFWQRVLLHEPRTVVKGIFF